MKSFCGTLKGGVRSRTFPPLGRPSPWRDHPSATPDHHTKEEDSNWHEASPRNFSILIPFLGLTRVQRIFSLPVEHSEELPTADGRRLIAVSCYLPSDASFTGGAGRTAIVCNSLHGGAFEAGLVLAPLSRCKNVTPVKTRAGIQASQLLTPNIIGLPRIFLYFPTNLGGEKGGANLYKRPHDDSMHELPTLALQPRQCPV